MTLRRKQQYSTILLKTREGECYLTVFFDVDSIQVEFHILSDRYCSHPVKLSSDLQKALRFRLYCATLRASLL
jgi:hypothetical protein